MEEQDFLALSVDQRKALQRQLQTQGLYAGPIDGKSGDGVRTALKAQKAAQAEQARAAATAEAQARSDKLKEQEIANKRLELETAAKSSGAEDALKVAAALRKAAYDKDAQSGLGIAANVASGAPAVLAGVGAGRMMGTGVNALMDASQRSKNDVLAATAADRVAGLTTREGARTGATLAGAMPSENSIMRVGGRMFPQFALGAAMAGKGGLMLHDDNEDNGFYPQMVNRAAGLGMIGAGTGLAERGITYGVAPGVAPDAKSIAVINSNQLRRGNAIEEGPKLTPKQALVAEARTAGVSGAGRMNMQQLTDALRKLPKTGIMAPLAAGTLAYAATPSDAQAAEGGGSVTGRDKALTNAGVVAGGTLGLQRLFDALKGTGIGKAVVSGVKFIGERTGPVMLNDMATGLGSYLESKGIMSSPDQRVADLSGASELPQRNPLRSEPSPGNQYYPLSSGQMPQQQNQQQAAPEQPAQPQQSALPSFGSLDELAAAAEQDPQIAAMIRELVTARLGQAQAQ